MKQYEVVLIIDPVLSGDAVKVAAEMYIDYLKGEGNEIVHVEEWGLRELAYPIKKRSSGVYYVIEFKTTSSDAVSRLEIALGRDERIIRYLTVALDKYAVKYNQDKRAGLIGKRKKELLKDIERAKDDLDEILND